MSLYIVYDINSINSVYNMIEYRCVALVQHILRTYCFGLRILKNVATTAIR